MFPHQYRTTLKGVVDDFYKIFTSNFEDNAENLAGKWNEVIRNRGIGQAGIRECKPVFVAAIHRLITAGKVNWEAGPNHLRTLLGFLKQLFTMEMSLYRD